jgi:hypothetical protein
MGWMVALEIGKKQMKVGGQHTFGSFGGTGRLDNKIIVIIEIPK